MGAQVSVDLNMTSNFFQLVQQDTLHFTGYKYLVTANLYIKTTLIQRCTNLQCNIWTVHSWRLTATHLVTSLDSLVFSVLLNLTFVIFRGNVGSFTFCSSSQLCSSCIKMANHFLWSAAAKWEGSFYRWGNMKFLVF